MSMPQARDPEIRLLPPERMLYDCEAPDCVDQACWETSYNLGEEGCPGGLIVKYACDEHAEEFGRAFGMEFPPQDATWSSCCSVAET